ncbi:MAG: hypothetical protein IJ652_01050 [Bacteroidales bacterium]|nr:hypothetical protein [Bacteroidales bacterium]
MENTLYKVLFAVLAVGMLFLLFAAFPYFLMAAGVGLLLWGLYRLVKRLFPATAGAKSEGSAPKARPQSGQKPQPDFSDVKDVEYKKIER